jgi:hypothetical protein
MPTRLTWEWNIEGDEFGSCSLILSNVVLYSGGEEIELSTYDDETNGNYLDLDIKEIICDYAPETHKFFEYTIIQ